MNTTTKLQAAIYSLEKMINEDVKLTIEIIELQRKKHNHQTRMLRQIETCQAFLEQI